MLSDIAPSTTASPTTVPDPVGTAELCFPDGIPGFPGERRFVLADVAPDSAFQELRSLDDPELAFIVSSPWLFFPDYALELSDSDRRELGVEAPGDAVVFCTVTVEDAEPVAVFLNLLAPFVVHAGTRVGRQVILDDPSLPLRAPLVLEEAV